MINGMRLEKISDLCCMEQSIGTGWYGFRKAILAAEGGSSLCHTAFVFIRQNILVWRRGETIIAAWPQATGYIVTLLYQR